jgi:FlaA1/EpsC-like NDP-sugar epimerase
MKNFFLNLTRRQKQVVILLADIVAVLFSVYVSQVIDKEVVVKLSKPDLIVWFLAPVFAIGIFNDYGLYNAVVRYLGAKAIASIFKAITIYAFLWGLTANLTSLVTWSGAIINWLLLLVVLGGGRMLARSMILQATNSKEERGATLIYGAGSAGMQLASALAFSARHNPVAFVDDDSSVQGTTVNGLTVYDASQIEELVEKEGISEVLLALPSASYGTRKKILNRLEHLPVHVRMLPGVAELAQGKVKVDDVRDVDIIDLLGRDPVAPDEQLLHANITGKVVMVTGAGGSIGSELCRQIARLDPKQLVLYEHSEFNLYAMDNEFREHGLSCLPLLGSVDNLQRMKRVCEAFGVQTIYHAAAYKHVPIVEKNPVMAIRNNIFGTWTAARAASESGVETFVLISTDKAVRPTNVMGASKRFAELILQGMSRQPGQQTRFVMVRFGNVLGSSGSVVPLFSEQIREGGPVTVTHPDIIRFFMTIPEAAQLVIQAGAMGKGGDVFVLDMGEPVRIMDLARRMIHLSGFQVRDEDNPDGDIEVRVTGLRPGEKLYEELLIGENVTETAHPRIMRASEEELQWNEIEQYLAQYDTAIVENDVEKIRQLLLESVRGYKPQCGIEDLLWNRTRGEG